METLENSPNIWCWHASNGIGRCGPVGRAVRGYRRRRALAVLGGTNAGGRHTAGANAEEKSEQQQRPWGKGEKVINMIDFAYQSTL